jgi:hypothetical protein
MHRILVHPLGAGGTCPRHCTARRRAAISDFALQRFLSRITERAGPLIGGVRPVLCQRKFVALVDVLYRRILAPDTAQSQLQRLAGDDRALDIS